MTIWHLIDAIPHRRELGEHDLDDGQIAGVLEVAKSALLSELDRPPQNAEAATLANDGLGTPCTVGTRAGNTVAPPYDSEGTEAP